MVIPNTTGLVSIQSYKCTITPYVYTGSTVNCGIMIDIKACFSLLTFDDANIAVVLFQICSINLHNFTVESTGFLYYTC